MIDPSIAPEIIKWLSRLTGMAESAFADLSLQEKADEIAKWYASKVVTEQVAILLCALAIVENDTNSRGLAKLFGSREATATALGEFNYVSGMSECPHTAEHVTLPLMGRKAYRPFLRRDTGKAILDLCAEAGFANSNVSPASVADGILKGGLSPSKARSILGTMRDFSKGDPQAIPRLLRALMALREQTVDVIAAVDEIDGKVANVTGAADESA